MYMIPQRGVSKCDTLSGRRTSQQSPAIMRITAPYVFHLSHAGSSVDAMACSYSSRSPVAKATPHLHNDHKVADGAIVSRSVALPRFAVLRREYAKRFLLSPSMRHPCLPLVWISPCA